MSTVTVEITGHLAETPEIRFLDSGRAVTNFTVIGNDRKFDEQRGEWVDAHTTAIRVTAWGKLAENLADTLTVGNLVTVTGNRLTASAYTPKDGGAPRASLELTADRIAVELATQTATITKNPRPDTTTA